MGIQLSVTSDKYGH